MKRKLIAILIVTMTITMLGCTKNKNENVGGESKPTSNQQEPSKDKDKTKEEDKDKDKQQGSSKKRSQEEMFKLHEELMPKVEEVCKKENIPLKVLKDKQNTKYDGVTHLVFDRDITEIGKCGKVTYQMAFQQEGGEAREISTLIHINVDDEDIKKNGYKFEDTLMYEVAKVFMPNRTDVSKINADIKKMYEEGKVGKSLVYNYEDGLCEDFSIERGYIMYSIVIENEEIGS